MYAYEKMIAWEIGEGEGLVEKSKEEIEKSEKREQNNAMETEEKFGRKVTKSKQKKRAGMTI